MSERLTQLALPPVWIISLAVNCIQLTGLDKPFQTGSRSDTLSISKE